MLTLLIQTTPTVQTKVDTIYIADKSTDILQQIINNQNNYYSNLILLILGVIVLLTSLSIYFNYIKVKSTILAELREEFNKINERVKSNLLNLVEVKTTEKVKEIENKLSIVSRENYKITAYHLLKSDSYITSISWSIAALKQCTLLNTNTSVREILDYLYRGITGSLRFHSPKSVYKSLTGSQPIEWIKTTLDNLDIAFEPEKEKIMELVIKIEKGKDDDTNPV